MLHQVDLDDRDLRYLTQSIALSATSRQQGKHPFAALVVAADGSVLAEVGNNSLPPDGDPTQHAELRAAQQAARAHEGFWQPR